MGDIAFFIGAFVGTFLISRLVWLAARWWPNSMGKAAVLSLVSAALVVTLAAWGNADGGPLNFASAPFYIAAQALVFAMDAWRIRKQPEAA